jgi:hypothetical protein
LNFLHLTQDQTSGKFWEKETLWSILIFYEHSQWTYVDFLSNDFLFMVQTQPKANKNYREVNEFNFCSLIIFLWTQWTPRQK